MKQRAAAIWECDPAVDPGERRRLQPRTASRSRSRNWRRRSPSTSSTRSWAAPSVAPEGSTNAFGVAHRRRRGRSRNRQGDRPPLHRHPGRRQGGPSQLRRRPDAGRRGAGDRLGAERGVLLRRQGPDAERQLPRLPHADLPRRADDRDDHRRGARTRRIPIGVRGVGETPIVPPPAAIANAIHEAVGVRMTELPMSPPKLWKALVQKP